MNLIDIGTVRAINRYPVKSMAGAYCAVEALGAIAVGDHVLLARSA